MSNEITNNHMFMNTNAKSVVQSSQKETMNKKSNKQISFSANSMNCLGALGYAKVNMDNKKIEDSVTEFKNDPESVALIVELEDNLRQRGINPYKANEISSAIYYTLKDKSTYHS